MKSGHWCSLGLLFIIMSGCTIQSQNAPSNNVPSANISPPPNNDLQWIANQVFRNETGGNAFNLVSWNNRETFPSLGIGHFIWYPQGQRGPYTETFPAYLNYCRAHGIALPGWLASYPSLGAPWPTKVAFDYAQNDAEMQELRRFLEQTQTVQVSFMLERLNDSLPKLLEPLDPLDQEWVLNQFLALKQTPGGLYPLLDYTNFKGEGINPNERYQGQGWGLLQVLLTMPPVQPGPQALHEFARAADIVLIQRVANAPWDRQEQARLMGWRKRISTYRPSLMLAAY